MRQVRVRLVSKVRRTRKRIADDMQRLRQKLLVDLEDVFNMAKGYAQNQDVTAKQKQHWIRIMAYTGQVMNSITKSFDEAQVTEDLQKLEKMINEAMAKEKGGRRTATG